MSVISEFKHIGSPPQEEAKGGHQRPVTFEEMTLYDSIFTDVEPTSVEINRCKLPNITINGILVTDLLETWKKSRG